MRLMTISDKTIEAVQLQIVVKARLLEQHEKARDDAARRLAETEAELAALSEQLGLTDDSSPADDEVNQRVGARSDLH